MATDPLNSLKGMGLSTDNEEEECKKLICVDESDALKKYNRKLNKDS